jgi:hypothetical protein
MSEAESILTPASLLSEKRQWEQSSSTTSRFFVPPPANDLHSVGRLVGIVIIGTSRLRRCACVVLQQPKQLS